MRKILLSLTMICLLTACTEEVMQELQSNTYDSKLTISFWTNELQQNSELWQQALPYCQANPMKVNCAAVREAWVQYNLSQHMVAGQPGPIARRLIRNRVLNNG